MTTTSVQCEVRFWFDGKTVIVCVVGPKVPCTPSSKEGRLNVTNGPGRQVREIAGYG